MKTTFSLCLLLLVRSLVCANAPDDRKVARTEGNEPFVNSLGMKFVPVPNAKVSFCIWNTRVRDFRTYAEATGYKQTGGMYVMKEGPVGDGNILPTWYLKMEASWEHPGFEQTEDHPVVGINWFEAQAFCAWLSKKEGRLYRLPTSAEWTAAVGPTKYPWGDTLPPPKGAGNFGDRTYFNVLKQRGGQPSELGDYEDSYVWTSPVGVFSPNRLGLYDMGGNALQWCEDYRAPKAARFETRKEQRVIRGSAWTDTGGQLFWSAPGNHGSRFDDPKQRNDTYGFRCVLETAGN